MEGVLDVNQSCDLRFCDLKDLGSPYPMPVIAILTSVLVASRGIAKWKESFEALGSGDLVPETLDQNKTRTQVSFADR